MTDQENAYLRRPYLRSPKYEVNYHATKFVSKYWAKSLYTESKNPTKNCMTQAQLF